MSESGVEHHRVGKIEYLTSESAEIRYFFNRRDNCWILEDLGSDKPGEGQQIIRSFVDKVGKDQKIKATSIIEKETIKRLSELGILAHADREKKTLSFSPHSRVLDTLKIVRVLRGGGIKIDKVLIIPLEDPSQEDIEALGGYKVSIEIEGRT